jgi:hypothetical protein
VSLRPGDKFGERRLAGTLIHGSRDPTPWRPGRISEYLAFVQSNYGAEMESVEARSRLTSVLDVCEHETQALHALRDARLSGVLQAMTTLRAEIVAALASLTPGASNGASS